MRLRPRLVALGVVASVAAAGLIGAASGAAGRGAREVVSVTDLRSPARFDGAAPLAQRIAWQPASGGIDWGELRLRGAGEAWRMRVIVARFDPRRLRLSLAPAFADRRRWNVADVDSGAVLALDAGQFRGSSPWGWVLSGGRELLKPQYAPLAGAVVVDDSGAVRVLGPDQLDAARASGTVREAFQSYPLLLTDGVVPAPLRFEGLGVSVTHRDARLALGTLDDGRVVIALSRFDALGQSLDRVPFGFTSAEMATIMGSLGCRQALMLDGGISGQLMVREADGTARSWPGVRSVPLGLVAHLAR